MFLQDVCQPKYSEKNNGLNMPEVGPSVFRAFRWLSNDEAL